MKLESWTSRINFLLASLVVVEYWFGSIRSLSRPINVYIRDLALFAFHWSVPGAGLRRLGKVLHMSKSGNLIVRLEQPPVPAERTGVVDYKIKRIGTVNNILGPVKSPYVSVKPEATGEGFAGRVLYLLEDN